MNEGLRSAGANAAEFEPLVFTGGAMIGPRAVGAAGRGAPRPSELAGLAESAASPSPDAGESLFADRLPNKLFVAATAFRTAWRPLSSTLPPVVAVPAE